MVIIDEPLVFHLLGDETHPQTGKLVTVVGGLIRNWSRHPEARSDENQLGTKAIRGQITH